MQEDLVAAGAEGLRPDEAEALVEPQLDDRPLDEDAPGAVAVATAAAAAAARRRAAALGGAEVVEAVRACTCGAMSPAAAAAEDGAAAALVVVEVPSAGHVDFGVEICTPVLWVCQVVVWRCGSHVCAAV